MPQDDSRIPAFISAVLRGAQGIKLGPGVLATIVPINTVGLVSLAIIAYALSAHPTTAFLAIGLGIGFLVYANERAFRYAVEHPIPALFSGSELLQLFRDQMSSRDKNIVVNEPPVIGATTEAIEQKHDE